MVAEPGATVADLVRSLIATDPTGEYAAEGLVPESSALEIRSSLDSNEVEAFSAEEILEDLEPCSGVLLRVVDQDQVPSVYVGEVEILEPDGRRRMESLYSGRRLIGRDRTCDLVVRDRMVSKIHARISAAPGRIEIIDLNSANGVWLTDAMVPRADVSHAGPVTIGDTTLWFHLAESAEPPSVEIQRHRYTRTPRVETRFGAVTLQSADLPAPPEKPPFPWLMVLMPAVAGAAMYMITRSPYSLIFIAMSPLMMLGNWMQGKTRGKRSHKEALARFREQLDRLAVRIAALREDEVRTRRAEVPALDEVVDGVRELRDPLWTRRPEHWSFLFLRLGVGTAPSRVAVKEPQGRDRAIKEFEEEFDELVERHKDVSDVPIVEDLAAAGSLGIVGEGPVAGDYARGLVAQLVGLHGPTDVGVAAIVGDHWGEEMKALKWMPHVRTGEAQLGNAIGATPHGAMNVLAQLEELVASRQPKRAGEQRLGALSEDESALKSGAKVGESLGASAGYKGPTPALVVLIADDAPVDRARLIQLSEKAVGTGVFPIWMVKNRANLPAACRTYVTLDTDEPEAHFVRLGTTVGPMEVEGLSVDEGRRFALGLARVEDAGAVEEDTTDLPSMISLVDLLGPDSASDASSVADRWVQNGSLPDGSGKPQGYAPRLRAIVGQAAHGAFRLDLREDGPHALVGGTTGAGKSEFLQAWVLGLASEYSSRRLTFLFVDYKGGSAFAECTKLPHCVGLVTDLSPHLVRRALISLRSELHYREHLFNEKGAKDILEFEKRGDPDCPPALVLVIDEFAALVSEVPDFVDGVVDIAQRGRSLGIHLIMATQRPAGVIRDNLRANTNLRVALRMADESDSTDVIGDQAAAMIPPEQRGRGLVKAGPGRLTRFQSAYTGGHSDVANPHKQVDFATFGFGLPEPWPEGDEGDHNTTGPNDQERLVARITEAHAGLKLPHPRRPWLDELPHVIDQLQLVGGPDTSLSLGLIDMPQRQAQEVLKFEPDVDQNMAIFGAGGSGRTAVLRAIAFAAGCASDPVYVYGLESGGSGLRMIESMPHVGSVVPGDDSERVLRMMRMLRQTVDERASKYGNADVGSISEYRAATGNTGEPRIIVLVDNFAIFRSEYDGVQGRNQAYSDLMAVMQEGRSVGVHVVVTADRVVGVGNAALASVLKRLALRMSDPEGYPPLGSPKDVLNEDSPVGRGLHGSLEFQIAVPAGRTNPREVSAVFSDLATRVASAGRPPAPPVGELPRQYDAVSLPAGLGEKFVLGLSEVDLGPFGVDGTGAVLVSGPPESGRSSALVWSVASFRRWRPDARIFGLSARRSSLLAHSWWDGTGADPRELVGLEDAIALANAGGPPVMVVIESVADFAESPSESSLVDLIKRARRGQLLVVAETAVTELSGFGMLTNELRNGRRGLALMPDAADGETAFRTPFPRVKSAEFSPGRGMWVGGGKVVRVQLPMPLDASIIPGSTAGPLTEGAGRSGASVPGADADVSQPASASDGGGLPDWAVLPPRG